MKTKFFYAFMCSLCVNAASFGQGTKWDITGNNTITAANFLGPVNNAALSFRTFNTQFMYINNFVMGSPPGAVAIGQNFSTPLSLLHINSNGQSVVTGETFRTTSNATGSNFNAWRMFTGTGAGTEKFSLYVPASSNNVVFQATQTTGELRFNTAGLAGRRFRIFSNGNVEVGDYNLFTPQSILHLHSQPAIPNGTKTYMQITDGGTGVAATDGFKIGTSNGIAEVRQQENLDMCFFTNDTERIKITSEGEVQINALRCENCVVMTDKEGKLYAKKKNVMIENDCEIANLETRISMLEKKIEELTALLANNK